MKKLNIALALIMCAWTAHATDVATSQAYVDTATGNLQTNLPAKTTNKVVTYTTTAGTTGEREIKTTLGNESTNQSDTGIPTVGTVKTAVDDKQNKVQSLPSTNIVTYTGTNNDLNATSNYYGRGIVTTTPIYDSTVNTFDNGLVTAKTLNDAVIAGVNAEVTRINTPQGALWQFNRTAPKVLPTTANLPANVQGTSYCYRRVQTNAEYNNASLQNDCSATMFNNFARGDWGVTFPYRTGITYNNDTCVGTECYKEIHGISACVDEWVAPYNHYGNPVLSESLGNTLDAAYETGKTGASPSGRICYCKLKAPVATGIRWVINRSYDDVTACAAHCVQSCSINTQLRVSFRTGMFSSVSVPATQSE